VIATGLPWFGGILTADGFDVPLALLFTDTATGGIPIAVLLLLAAAVGLGVALITPVPRVLGTTFLAVGAASTLVMLWYVIRVLSLAEGASLFDALSVGVWVAILGSLGALGFGIALRMTRAAP
jgi:hypothetical protein